MIFLDVFRRVVYLYIKDIMKIYFTQKLAALIINDYQNLIGQTFSTQFGELVIDRISAIQVANDEYDIILSSNVDNVNFREIYQVLNINQIRLLDYLEFKDLEFNPRRYGALLGKFTTEKDKNGIDRYL